MRLDVDVVREILISLQDANTARVDCTGAAIDLLDVSVDGHAAADVSEHVRLLEEGGYLQAIQRRKGERLFWYPARLTWQGHQLAESMLSQRAFERAKQAVSKALGYVSLEAVKAALPVIRDEMMKHLR
jgi:hypothetical protein